MEEIYQFSEIKFFVRVRCHRCRRWRFRKSGGDETVKVDMNKAMNAWWFFAWKFSRWGSVFWGGWTSQPSCNIYTMYRMRTAHSFLVMKWIFIFRSFPIALSFSYFAVIFSRMSLLPFASAVRRRTLIVSSELNVAHSLPRFIDRIQYMYFMIRCVSSIYLPIARWKFFKVGRAFFSHINF